jgi:N-acetylglucosaminyl-diphospho-decaprenol L-rhamnosyltransferase
MDRLPAGADTLVPPEVTVIVVNYNTANLLGPMFASLEAARGALSLQVIVVDNASRDNSVELLRTHFQNVELIQNRTNVGFGRANNQVLSQARGRYLLLLNTDAFVAPDTLTKTLEFMEGHPQCGVLGVKLIGRDGSLQPSCRYFPTPWNIFLASTGLKRFFPATRLVDDMSWNHMSVRECDWVPGCYYLIRREVVEQVGLFDPRYFLYFEEVDHCRAVRHAGWSVVYYPFTTVMHIGGESAVTDGPIADSGRQIPAFQIESELLYFRKHYGLGGAIVAAFLSLLTDFIRMCATILRRTDKALAVRAAHHARAVLKLLVATRFASRPTR